MNFGHLLGEVIRRVSGKPLKRFAAEEIAGPLGADFQIGAAEEDWGRIANVIPPPPYISTLTPWERTTRASRPRRDPSWRRTRPTRRTGAARTWAG